MGRAGEYKVVFAPIGNGRDTHRAWESLGVGAVILVAAGIPLNEAFVGLPAIPVADWASASSPQFVVQAYLRAHGDDETAARVPAGCAAIEFLESLKTRGGSQPTPPPSAEWDFDRVYYPWWLFRIRCLGEERGWRAHRLLSMAPLRMRLDSPRPRTPWNPCPSAQLAILFSSPAAFVKSCRVATLKPKCAGPPPTPIAFTLWMITSRSTDWSSPRGRISSICVGGGSYRGREAVA